MAEIKQTERASRLLNKAFECCKSHRHEFIMPEHLLSALLNEENFNSALNIFYDPQDLAKRVEDFLGQIESIPEGLEYEPEVSHSSFGWRNP